MQRSLIVVDDNEPFAKLLCEVAKRRGWECRIFGTGRELMEAISSIQTPALLLLDLLMPDLDGIETISELSKAQSPALRIRFMTGGDPRNASAANLIATSLSFNLGRTIYKPVSMQELDAMMLEEEGNLLKLNARPTTEN